MQDDIDQEKLGEDFSIEKLKNIKKYPELFTAVTQYFEEEFGKNIGNELGNNIANLALLGRYTNRAYKDAPFKRKRGWIIFDEIKSKEVLEQRNEGFQVPLCTKNTFLKVYSKKNNRVNSWNEDDMTDYRDAIYKTLKDYDVKNTNGDPA